MRDTTVEFEYVHDDGNITYEEAIVESAILYDRRDDGGFFQWQEIVTIYLPECIRPHERGHYRERISKLFYG